MKLILAGAICLIAVAATPREGLNQYIYLDTNGNGVHDAGDLLNGRSATNLDVWLVTNANRDGSPAGCSDAGYPLSITGYIGGSGTFGAREPRKE